MPITTTGLVSLVAGEDWHIVGSGGSEPAFGTGWSNASATYYPKMSFRLREAGIVDLVGCVTTDGTTDEIFTFPEGYRPIASLGIMPVTMNRSSDNFGELLVVNDVGEVVAATGYLASDVFYICGSFFTDSPTAIS